MGMTPRHPATVHLLSLFEYDHLPPHLQAISRPCYDLAHGMADKLADGPELSAGLRHLVEAKDCLVRQAVIDAKADVLAIVDEARAHPERRVKRDGTKVGEPEAES